MKNIVLFAIILFMVGCRESNSKNNQVDDPEYYYPEYGQSRVEIVKVRECEYVLWHSGYGSDMEHYEGCSNKQHHIK